MIAHYDAVVWINAQEARVYHFDRSHLDTAVLDLQKPDSCIEPAAPCTKTASTFDYLGRVASSVSDADAILIIGPASTKTQLMKYIHHFSPELMDHVVGIETVDYPNVGEFIAYARTYFEAGDRMPS